MKDVMELLRAKEQELSKVKRQVEALRIALPLLRTEDDPLVPVPSCQQAKPGIELIQSSESRVCFAAVTGLFLTAHLDFKPKERATDKSVRPARAPNSHCVTVAW